MVAQDHARTYRANVVLTASPGQLVLMLYDGALRALHLASEAFARPTEDHRRLEEINKQLLKAQAIISELEATLNFNAGDGKLAEEMARLYEYYNHRLLQANLRKDPAPVVEVARLLREIRDSWAEMLAKHTGEPATSLRGVA